MHSPRVNKPLWRAVMALFVAAFIGVGLVGTASRLSELIKNPPTLYLPARLLLGQTSQLIVKAPVGHTVVIVFGPAPKDNSVATRPDGEPLKVSADCQTLEMVANEKGVAVFPITVPDAPQLAGQHMVIDGYTVSSDGVTVESLVWVDPMGRSALRNEVLMDTVSDGSGAMIMPGLPGIGAGMARQLGTLRDVNSGGERMKDLVDDGSRGNTMLDRNSFIKRVDGVGSAGP